MKKFTYNPTLDRLLLAAAYVQKGKMKKATKTISTMLDHENISKDMAVLDKLQMTAKQSEIGFYRSPEQTMVEQIQKDVKQIHKIKSKNRNVMVKRIQKNIEKLYELAKKRKNQNAEDSLIDVIDALDEENFTGVIDILAETWDYFSIPSNEVPKGKQRKLLRRQGYRLSG